MPNLSNLLHDTAADDIDDVLIPEGYWSGTIKSAKLYDKDKEGNVLTDKNGNEYARAVLYIACETPVDGVDDAEAEKYFDAGGPREQLARYNAFIRGARDIKKLTATLSECGALTVGRPFARMLQELKGQGVAVQVLIEHEEYNDEMQANATEIAAA